MLEMEEFIRAILMEIAHYPAYLYMGVTLILCASSFGLPLPEEVVLITSGMIANIAMQESEITGLPPTVNPVSLALVCMGAVLISDLVVFSLGRRYGLSLMRRRPLSRVMTPSRISKVEGWTLAYGAWACGIFRFTPGLRFPGHFMCGAMKISYVKFLATDGVAALLTVPTQVLLLAYYGDEILRHIKHFKFSLLILLVVGVVIYMLVRNLRASQPGSPPNSSGSAA